ncbi:hypothetical protein ACHAQJ_001130 [Trichoderma viride]
MSGYFAGFRDKPPGRRNEQLKHEINASDTDEEVEQPTYRFGKNTLNQSHHIFTGIFNESLQSSPPNDDDLNIFPESNSGTAKATEAFHRGPKAEQVEREGLSINIPLLTNTGELKDPVQRKYQADYWKIEKTEIPKFKTHLQTIDSLEYSVEEMGQGKVALSCSEGPPKKEETPTSTQIKWLHLQGTTMSLDIFISLIMNCHLIDKELATVAIKLIHKVEEKFLRDSENGPYIEPGSVLRCTAWVDLFNIALDAVKKKRSEFDNYNLRDEKNKILSAERWIEMVKSKKSQSYTFYLIRKNNTPLNPLRLLEYRPAKRRRSEGSSQMARSLGRESEMPGLASQRSPQMESSPDFSKRIYAMHREPIEIEEREPLFEFSAGGIHESSHDPKENIALPNQGRLFARYEKPTVRSLHSSDKESSLDKREDTSALQVHDDTISQAIAPQDSDAQDVYRDGKGPRSRGLHLPYVSSVGIFKFPSLNSAGNARLIDAETNRKTQSQPNLGNTIHNPRYSLPIIIRAMDDSMVDGKLASTESFDESIDLSDAGKNSKRPTKRRHQRNRKDSESSIEVYCSEIFHSNR